MDVFDDENVASDDDPEDGGGGGLGEPGTIFRAGLCELFSYRLRFLQAARYSPPREKPTRVIYRSGRLNKLRPRILIGIQITQKSRGRMDGRGGTDARLSLSRVAT